MPETHTILQDGVDRFREAAGNLTTELQRVQRELRARRKKLEKRLETSRKDIEKRFASQRKDLGKRLESQRKQLEKRLEKSPALKRLDTIRKDAAKQIEQGVSDVLSALQIASRSDLQRVDRKISALSKQVKEMSSSKRKRSNGSASTTA